MARQRRSGRSLEAEAACRAALGAAPNDPAALHLLGMLTCEAGRMEEALALLRRAAALEPGRAPYLANLGAVLGRMGRHVEALGPLREAVRLGADRPEAHNNLGAALEAGDQLAEAVECFGWAVALRPGYVAAHANLANALRGMGQIDRAEAAAREAVRLAPGSAEAQLALGGVLQERGQLDAAMQCAERAIALEPGHVEGHVQRGVTLLLSGELAQGFKEYEWRRRRNQPIWKQHFPGVAWDGTQPVAGKRLLLWAEGGMGNTIQFIRYAPMLAERGAEVIVQCQPALKELLAGAAGVSRTVAAREALPGCDLHAPLPSLPGLVGTTLQTIPATVPYLHAQERLVAQWRQRLLNNAGLRIGINWQSDPRTVRGRLRCIPLGCFAALAPVPGVSLYNLHSQPAPMGELAERFVLHDVLESNDPPSRFAQTAAFVKCLDLVITSDTSTAHLAGALGVPTWVALREGCDWRWMLGREDSPWYPTMRLYRQASPGDWDSVFFRMMRDVQELKRSRGMNRGEQTGFVSHEL